MLKAELTPETFSSGEVVKQDDIKCVIGEGMPIYRDPFTKGRLVIQFNVNFPSNNFAPLKQIKELETILPPKKVSY